MSPAPLHSVSVAGAVIADDGRVLAIRRRDNGHWELPGGVLELDETVTDGVVREVREETGLTVQPERLTGVYKNMTRSIIALVFRCQLRHGQPHATAETTAIAWLTEAEVNDRMNEAYAVRINDALRPAGAPTVRTHNGRHLIETAQQRFWTTLTQQTEG